MDVCRLLKDELSYELYIRGISGEGTVPDLRKRLSKALALKTAPMQHIYCKLPVSEELTTCEVKLTMLRELVEVAEEEDISNLKRLKTRLQHSYNRVERLTPSAEEEERKQTLLDAIQEQLENVGKVASETEQLLPPPVERGVPVTPEAPSRTTEESRHAVAPSFLLPSRGTTSEHQPRDLRLYKWGLKFTADDQCQSLGAFLAEVEDRRVARGVAKEELFRAASELLGGTALLWFRTKRATFRSWDELVKGLRQTFLDADYDHQLLSEIRKRTQGPYENPAVYIAKMEGLFSRLSNPLTEDQKLDMVMRNAKKDYLPLLPLTSFRTMNELETVLRNLEIGATRAARYEEPPARGHMEPDLAYQGPRYRTARASPISTPNVTATTPARERRPEWRHVRCWKCHQEGHMQRDCPNFTRKSGNGERDRQ